MALDSTLGKPTARVLPARSFTHGQAALEGPNVPPGLYDDTYIVTHSVAGLFHVFNSQKKVCMATGCNGDWIHVGSRPDGHGMTGVTEQLFSCNGSCDQLPIAFKVSDAPAGPTCSSSASRGPSENKVNEVEDAAMRMLNKMVAGAIPDIQKQASSQAGTTRLETGQAAHPDAAKKCLTHHTDRKASQKQRAAAAVKNVKAAPSHTGLAVEEFNCDGDGEPYAIGIECTAPLSMS
eukprot:SAG31_NODE_3870_length_3798_cov_2.788862_1_plen_235_part_00